MDSPRAAKPAAKPRPRPIIAFIARVLQIVFCLICLACAAHWAKTWAPFKTSSFQVYAILQSVNFAIFISFFGMLLSSFLLFAPRLTPKLADDLPGLVDLLISGIWAVFFLSMGGSLLSWGACKSSSLCLAWNATVGIGFLLWILYSVTAVLAAWDLKDQLAALREAAATAAAASNTVPLATKKADKPSSRPGSVASSHNGDKPPSRPASVAGSHSGSDNNV